MQAAPTLTIRGRSGSAYVFTLYECELANAKWNHDAGVYIVLKREFVIDKLSIEEKNALIYVGETDNLGERHANHHKKDCFARHKANCLGFLSESAGDRRLAIETDIRNNGEKWPCNDQ